MDQEKKPPTKDDQILKSELEKALEDEDRDLAREIQRSRAQLLIAQRRAIITQTGAKTDEGAGAKKEGRDDYLVTIATGFLDRGIDVKIVGQIIQYLIGANQPFPLGGVGALGATGAGTQQGITISDMKILFEMGRDSNRSDDSMKEILNKLTDKITALEAKSVLPPPARGIIVVKPDGTIEEVEAGKPVIVQPPAPSVAGESLEVIKEKNRHAEKLEELKTERDYKTGMVDAVGNLAEDIGAGAASQVLHKEAPREKTGGVLETVECSGCHATIYVTPETDKVTCAKCGVVSERPKTERAKA